MKVDDDIASLRWLAREFDALSDDCLKIFSDPNQIKNDSLRRCFVDNPANPSNPSNPDKQKEQREQRERLISEIESRLYKPAFCESNSGSTDAPNQVVSIAIRILYKTNPVTLKCALRVLGMTPSQLDFMSQNERRMCGEMYQHLDDRTNELEVGPPCEEFKRTILKVLADMCRAQAEKLKMEAGWKDDIRQLKGKSRSPTGFSDLEKRIIVKSILDGNLNQTEIADELHISQGTVSRALKKMEAACAQKPSSSAKVRTVTMDPSILALGERVDGRTPRQRGQSED